MQKLTHNCTLLNWWRTIMVHLRQPSYINISILYPPPPTLTYEEKTNYLLVCIICLIDTVCHHVVQKVALLDEAYCTEQLMPACTKKHHSG
jgi:hypothetical protein